MVNTTRSALEHRRANAGTLLFEGKFVYFSLTMDARGGTI